MGRLIRLIAVLVLSLGLVSRIGCVKGSDPPREIITNSIGMQFTYIPPGTFWMGRLRGRQGSQTELPRHFVRLTRGFYIGITEVTQGQWSRVMRTRPWVGVGNVQEGSEYPITYITWDAAAEFCKRLSEQEGRHYRLPTEAEWEYACRGGTRTAYSFGSDASVLGDYAWFYDNTHEAGHEYAHLVAQKKPNPWGLYDVHGNRPLL
ncbi:MAG: formylglycine-generating enzyme family protein [Planctomycetota bacterium]|jgi:formylglycine-generating enzyme required for sulfatase activity